MDYKKIIKKPEIRYKILTLFNWIPDKLMLKFQYRVKLKRKLNLINPKRFTEKLQWYKLNYRNPVMHKCVDKFEVRKYVEEKGLKYILNEIYGVYDSADDINFNALPDKFVIKATNGGGGLNVLVCDNKEKFDTTNAIKMIRKWLNFKQKKSLGREWAYEGNTNKIIIEKYLEGNDENLSGINDYKFFCYNGKVEYIVFDGDRYVKHKRNIYDKEWNYLDIQTDCDKLGDCIKKPNNLSEMISVAEILAKDFPFVRVDLYSINGKIIFGELTFYPWSGYIQYKPDEFDFKLGKKFSIKL
ncbi:MAG: ATP-grasp fold amidoligase family protein [Clostridia bacterium]